MIFLDYKHHCQKTPSFSIENRLQFVEFGVKNKKWEGE